MRYHEPPLRSKANNHSHAYQIQEAGMRTAFEEEEEIASLDPQQDRELTISSTTLLAIFFSLVLICGLFFGLGYTLGRRAPSEASQSQSAASSASDLQPSSSVSKPSAASQTATSTTPEPTPSDPQTTDASSSTPTTADPLDDAAQNRTEPKISETTTPTPQQVKLTTTPLPAQPAATTLTPSSIPASAIPASAIMVQIAAISNPADANVLVGALQKRGYSVTTRHTPGDSLIHVQVGPFSNRADAIAMRQKLLSDGYNAILK
jgi:DedD protein